MNNVNGSFPSPDQIEHEITLTLDQLFSANCVGIYLQGDQLKLTEQLPVHLSVLHSFMCYRRRGYLTGICSLSLHVGIGKRDTTGYL